MPATHGDYAESPHTMFNQALHSESATKKHNFGTRRILDDGREFVYCGAGAVDLTAGLACTYITTGVNEQTVTVAHAAGTKAVTVTCAGATLNLYAEGYLVVTAGTGIGESYKIKGNSAAAASRNSGMIHHHSFLFFSPVFGETGWLSQNRRRIVLRRIFPSSR